MPGPDGEHGPQRGSRQSAGVSARQKERVGRSGGAGMRNRTGERRQGIPVTINERDGSSFSLSPLLYNLPSISGISSLKGYLPTSPSKNASKALPAVDSFQSNRGRLTLASWQHGDLGDGKGLRPLLLVSTQRHTLRVFSQAPSSLPADPHVKEEFPPPIEILSIPHLISDGNAITRDLGRVDGRIGTLDGIVVQAHVLSASQDGSGPRVLLLIQSTHDQRSSRWSMAKVDLGSGRVLVHLDIGPSVAARFEISGKQLVLAVGTSLQLLDASTLEARDVEISDASSIPNSTTSTFALSGRLVAYVTETPPTSVNTHGYGTLVTAHATSRSRIVSAGPEAAPRPIPSTAQPERYNSAAILSSAVGLGGFAARGVLAGLKMGARAANQARSTGFARSAPVEGSILAEEEGVESRSMEESVTLENSLEEPMVESSTATSAGVQWIKVVDVQRGSRVIAHFRLPRSRSILADSSRNMPSEAGGGTAMLKFSPDGTQLLAAQADGRASHMFQIHSAGIGSSSRKRETYGEALHMYELKRGNTHAKVTDVVWDRAGRWVAVGTSRGTIHVYPVHPSGAPTTAASHASDRLNNPSELPRLSAVVTPVARLRYKPHSLSQQIPNESGDSETCIAASFAFGKFGANPLTNGQWFQEVHITRPEDGIVELVRLGTAKVQAQTPGDSVLRHGSALTEMMRNKSSDSDLSVRSALKAKWILPEAEDELVNLQAGMTVRTARRVSPLAFAEIRTYSINPRILPGSIYLSHQIDFYGARAIDEYSPLSIIDKEARQRRLVFRPEVRPHSSQSPAPTSFNEPLSTALHTVIDSPSRRPIPGLPNGLPGGKWSSHIPIRQVAHGVGEGLDKMRNQYARAQQASRRRRRASEAQGGIALSFEEDTIFASSPGQGQGEGHEDMPALGLGDGDAGSGTSSENNLPHTQSNTASSLGDSESWGDREWYDEEYRRAIQDEGPDDLVLGLMDEEEEERRQWVGGQKVKSGVAGSAAKR